MLRLVFISALLLVGSSCSRTTSVSVAPQPPITLIKSEANSTLVAIGFLENRVKDDPDDFVALNKLAGYYLKMHRETEKVRFLEQALTTAKASLKVMPADQNLGGVSVLAQAELSTHNFALARDLAQELTEYQPTKSFGYQLLGDALVELGEYEKALTTYKRMQQLDPGSLATEVRLGHLDLLRGDLANAQQRYEAALVQAQRASIPSDDTIAWTALKAGKIKEAREAMEEALRLGTKDAKMFFHAGMIARAAGDGPTAKDFFRRALELNPHFDLRQSPIAKTAIQQ